MFLHRWEDFSQNQFTFIFHRRPSYYICEYKRLHFAIINDRNIFYTQNIILYTQNKRKTTFLSLHVLQTNYYKDWQNRILSYIQNSNNFCRILKHLQRKMFKWPFINYVRGRGREGVGKISTYSYFGAEGQTEILT